MGSGLSDEEQNKDWKIRLDGIAYHPFMPFNTVPMCEPACFPVARNGSDTMGSAGCVKYCAPTMYLREADRLAQCQCTMVKRLNCWFHKGETQLRCGQYKQLIGVPKKLSKGSDNCDVICAQQLALLWYSP